LQRFIHQRIPITKAMGIRVSSFDRRGLTLTAPRAPNVNDKGTGFAGSVATLLTLSGWAMLELLLDGARSGLRIAVVESTLRYRRPVTGSLRATCARPARADWARFTAALRRKGMARNALRAGMGPARTSCARLEATYAVYGTRERWRPR
jgi:thioesterase domain-containing protein